jgi:pilus assembly protein Flp/PilA
MVITSANGEERGNVQVAGVFAGRQAMVWDGIWNGWLTVGGRPNPDLQSISTRTPIFVPDGPTNHFVIGPPLASHQCFILCRNASSQINLLEGLRRKQICSTLIKWNNQLLGDIYEQISAFYLGLIRAVSYGPSPAAESCGRTLRPKKLGDAVMKNFLARFAQDESGATAIEYGLIAALIGLAVVTAATTVGTNLKAVFEKIAEGLKLA